MKKLSFIILFVYSNLAFSAGGSVQAPCNQKYHSDVFITDFNVSTEVGGSYGMNVRFSDDPTDGSDNASTWYFLSLKEGSYLNRDALFETVKLAFVSGEKVNACYGNGYLTGVEMSTK